ncbi:MAG: LEA type 2 family protein [Gammaproteobacteria bacterium]|nr:LEA type 2 family protein [Gammaproteobacteria bacterium]
MNPQTRLHAGLVTVSVLLSACASLENVVSAPNVSLRNVHVQEVAFDKQTFLLAFDVTNPNPFPLPIKSISYSVRLDGHHFAGGEAASAFTVPSGSDGEFAISVDLNLLKTAPELLFIVRDAARRDIPYALEGKLAIDIPYTKPISFESNGDIRLLSAAY